MATSSITDLKPGRILKIDGDPNLIIWSQFLRMQARKPVMKTKLKNLKNGTVRNLSFAPGDSFELAEVNYQKVQYLYKDDQQAYFMDNQTYEQITVALDMLEEIAKYLVEGTTIDGVFFEGKMFSVQLPPKITLQVTDAPPAVKGDSATNATKQATLETGLTINVPLFIQTGDSVRINTATGDYVERVQNK